MKLVRLMEHRQDLGGCGWRWKFSGNTTSGYLGCPHCKGKIKLSEKDSRVLKKLVAMREKG